MEGWKHGLSQRLFRVLNRSGRQLLDGAHGFVSLWLPKTSNAPKRGVLRFAAVGVYMNVGYRQEIKTMNEFARIKF
jgi:hypothetical protein